LVGLFCQSSPAARISIDFVPPLERLGHPLLTLAVSLFYRYALLRSDLPDPSFMQDMLVLGYELGEFLPLRFR